MNDKRTRARGLTLISMLKYVREKKSEKGVEEVLNSLDEKTRNTILNPVPKDWYPFNAYIKLHVAIDKIIGNGDLSECKKVGRFIAEDNMKQFPKTVYLIFNTKKILRKTPVLWRKYEYPGEVVKIKDEENCAVYRLINFPSQPPICSVIIGRLEVALELAGAKNICISEPKCKALGDEYCEFV